MEYRKEKLFCKENFKLVTELTEFRMSVWITGFGLENAVTGEEVLPLFSYFNLDHIEELSEEILEIKFRIYPSGKKITRLKYILFQSSLNMKTKCTPPIIFVK